MTGAIDFGVYIPQVAYTYADLLAQARRVEEGGISCLWFYDHLYTPGLPAQGALEGWTLATAILAQTTRLRVGHLVLNNNFRHPVLLARMATTLDLISGGRLNLRIGSGSYQLEHHEGGFPWGSLGERTEQLEESLEILTRMFTSERTTFAGPHFTLREVLNLPPPRQQPHPPIYVDGVGKRYTLPLVARFAEVYVPTYGLVKWEHANRVLDEAAPRSAEIRHPCGGLWRRCWLWGRTRRGPGRPAPGLSAAVRGRDGAWRKAVLPVRCPGSRTGSRIGWTGASLKSCSFRPIGGKVRCSSSWRKR